MVEGAQVKIVRSKPAAHDIMPIDINMPIIDRRFYSRWREKRDGGGHNVDRQQGGGNGHAT